MLEGALAFGFAALGLALMLNLWRLFRGPGVADRILALDTMVINVIGLIVLLGGAAVVVGRQILRVPYYRPLPRLLPTDPLRRSEIHLSRQIFNGLTRRNEENGEIEGDLAHHWECLDPCHWRFYLRPAVRFHHGRELGVEDVMESLHALRERPLFAHLARLESPWPRTLDMYLDSPDPLLPHLLAEPVAAVMAASSTRATVSSPWPLRSASRSMPCCSTITAMARTPWAGTAMPKPSWGAIR